MDCLVLTWRLVLDGRRLALSAPNFNASSGEEGLVAVFDYDDAAWVQLGQNLTGTQQSEKFGFTMGLSEDGTTLVVGSPNKDVDGLTDSGSVQGALRKQLCRPWTHNNTVLFAHILLPAFLPHLDLVYTLNVATNTWDLATRNCWRRGW